MEENTFEQDLKKLEELVTKMDNEDLTLDESIALFEEGTKLSKKCNEKLENAERKINVLIEKKDGSISEEKFEI